MEPTLIHWLTVLILIVLPFAVSHQPTRIFTAGFITSSGVTMAWQDWMGLANYMIYLPDNWVNFSPLVGIVVVVMGMLSGYSATQIMKRRTYKVLHKLALDVYDGKFVPPGRRDTDEPDEHESNSI